MSAAAIPGLPIPQPPDLAAAAARVRQLETLLAEASGGRSGTPAGGGFAAALAAAQAPAAAQSAARAPAAAGVVAPGAAGLAGIPGAPAGGTGTLAPSAQLEGAAGLAGIPGAPAGGTGTLAPSAQLEGAGGAAESIVPTTGAMVEGGSTHAYDAVIEQAAARNGLSPAILHGLIEQESGFNPSARSSAGALGLTQLMPSTAAAMGVTEPLNPVQSIEGGARYLGTLMREFGGNATDALAAYNAGPGAVHTYGGVPPYPETEAYVARVLANAQAYGTAA